MVMNRFAWTAPESEPRLSEPRLRAGHGERTAPKGDKRDVERENRERKSERIESERARESARARERKSKGICQSVIIWSSVRICWSSEGKTHLSRLGKRHLVAGVLWFSARLVAGVVCV